MMLQEMENRRSIRHYKDRPVEDDLLRQLLEGARLAPSGSNTQPWHFIVVRSESVKKKLAVVSHNQEWMMTAPVYIICVADIRSRIKTGEITINETSPQMELKQIIRDTAIAAENIVLGAERLGLGTCWVAWFKQDDIRPILHIPSDKFVVCIITLGYADEAPKARTRKKPEDMIHYDTW